MKEYWFMINELYTMVQAMKQNNVLQGTTHPDIKEPANFPGIYIEISEEKEPCNIEYLNKDEFVSLWKHAKSNHNNFPIIRVQRPFLNHNLTKDFDDLWKKSRERSQKLQLLFKMNFEDYNDSSNDIIIKRWSIDKLIPVCEKSVELKPLYELIDRFPKDVKEQRLFYLKLLALIKERLSTYDSGMLDLIKDILIGSYDRSKNRFCSKTQIAFDIYDSQNYKYKIKDKRLKDILIKELNNKEMSENIKFELGVCQLTGEKQLIEEDKFPEPKLRVIGKSYLYSNNKDIPCLERYGLKSLMAYKVGKNTIRDLNDAISFLTVGERQFKTWVQVPSSSDKKQNLLIAYVENKPELEDDLARMLGDSPDYEQEVVNFEKLTEQVCSSLMKDIEKNSESKISTIVFSEVDPGRKQIILFKTFTEKDIILGTTKWKQAFHNSPKVEFKIKENQEEVVIKPYCPYPGEILTFSKKLWRVKVKDGKKYITYDFIHGISMREIYEIFIPLSDENEPSQKLLCRILDQVEDLILFVGHYTNRKELQKLNSIKVIKKNLYEVCLAVTLISILLFKQNHRKEDFMNSIAFNIGRLLMLSDVLHREYCKNVRKDIPPQLIGNSIMHTAVEFPIRALNLLEERIMIYKAWADTNTEMDVKYAKWAVNQMGIVSKIISEQEIPEMFNDAERAQVLLGYLAKIEKKEEE